MIRLFRCMRWSLHSSRTRKRQDSSGEPGIGVEMGLCVGLFLSIHNDGGGLNRKIWMMPGLCRWTSPWTSLRETDGPSRSWGEVAELARYAGWTAPVEAGARSRAGADRRCEGQPRGTERVPRTLCLLASRCRGVQDHDGHS